MLVYIFFMFQRVGAKIDSSVKKQKDLSLL